MNRQTTILVTAIAGALVLAPLAPRAQSAAEIALRQAIELEKVKGNTAGAIEAYRRLAESPDAKVAEQARDALARLGSTPSLASPTAFPSQSLDDLPSGLSQWEISPDGHLAVGLRRAGSDPRPEF